jgi:hypothetical protein
MKAKTLFVYTLLGAVNCFMPLAGINPLHAENPHLTFVKEYIRQLANLERLRDTANSELQGGASEKMSGCIRNGTRFQLELQSQISMLRDMQLNPPFNDLPSSLAAFDEKKIELYKKMSEGCEAMISGPKPDVDYDAIAAQTPKLTATMDYIDHAIFEATPLVFGTLIDPVPDANNKMSKLIITSAERKKLIPDIDLYFGAKLDQKDQPWLVSAAWVLRGYLLKDYTSSDVRPRLRK